MMSNILVLILVFLSTLFSYTCVSKYIIYALSHLQGT